MMIFIMMKEEIAMAKKSKKGQSLIISSVLLILLVIAVSFIIMGVVVPFVKNQLAGTDCFSAVGEVSIKNNIQYTCYDGNLMNVQIGVSDNNSLGGFAVELGGASSKTYEIKEGVNISGVSMYVGGEILELPGKNEERTYSFTASRPDSVRVYPILSDGRTCDKSDELNKISSC